MSDNDKMPAEFMSPLREAGIATHAMFLEFLAAGFTEAQALALCAEIIVKQGRTDD